MMSDLVKASISAVMFRVVAAAPLMASHSLEAYRRQIRSKFLLRPGLGKLLHVRPEDLEKWADIMSDKILSAAEEYRKKIENLLNKMSKGNGFGDDVQSCQRFQRQRDTHKFL